jgi:hypothetical protein
VTDKRVQQMCAALRDLTADVEEFAELREACRSIVDKRTDPEREALAARIEACILRIVEHSHVLTCPAVHTLVRVHGEDVVNHMLDRALAHAHEGMGDRYRHPPVNMWTSKGGDA